MLLHQLTTKPVFLASISISLTYVYPFLEEPSHDSADFVFAVFFHANGILHVFDSKPKHEGHLNSIAMGCKEVVKAFEVFRILHHLTKTTKKR